MSHFSRKLFGSLAVIAVCLSALVFAASAAQAQEKLDRAALEKKFEERMTGAVLIGSYTTGPIKAGLKEDRYTITSVKKLDGEIWSFKARVQYGDKDYEQEMRIPIRWAGDTPVICLDKSSIPVIGKYSARVMFDGDQYAGTWSATDHGGLLFGRIEKLKEGDQPSEGDKAKTPNKPKSDDKPKSDKPKSGDKPKGEPTKKKKADNNKNASNDNPKNNKNLDATAPGFKKGKLNVEPVKSDKNHAGPKGDLKHDNPKAAQGDKPRADQKNHLKGAKP